MCHLFSTSVINDLNEKSIQCVNFLSFKEKETKGEKKDRSIDRAKGILALLHNTLCIFMPILSIYQAAAQEGFNIFCLAFQFTVCWGYDCKEKKFD